MDIELVKLFLFWTSIINLAILTIWFFMFTFAKEFIYNLHSRWFDIEEKQFDRIHYMLMAFYKLAIFLFSLVPYIALSIVS